MVLHLYCVSAILVVKAMSYSPICTHTWHLGPRGARNRSTGPAISERLLYLWRHCRPLAQHFFVTGEHVDKAWHVIDDLRISPPCFCPQRCHPGSRRGVQGFKLRDSGSGNLLRWSTRVHTRQQVGCLPTLTVLIQVVWWNTSLTRCLWVSRGIWEMTWRVNGGRAELNQTEVARITCLRTVTAQTCFLL